MKLLKKEPNQVIDIGRNIGNYSSTLLKKSPNTEVFIFEPSSTNIRILKKRITNESKVKIMPYAISNSNSSATLYANAPGFG